MKRASKEHRNPTATSRAKQLRSRSTDAELTLWQQLRAKRLRGLKFRRQVPIDNYIADFCSMSYRIVIEVDGGQHNDSKNDEVRDSYLKEQGFRVLRFWNNDVLENTEGVVDAILNAVDDPSP